jgi:hypothetical protein
VALAPLLDCGSGRERQNDRDSLSSVNRRENQ